MKIESSDQDRKYTTKKPGMWLEDVWHMRGPTVTRDVLPPYTEAGSQLNVQAKGYVYSP